MFEKKITLPTPWGSFLKNHEKNQLQPSTSTFNFNNQNNGRILSILLLHFGHLKRRLLDAQEIHTTCPQLRATGLCVVLLKSS